MAFTMIVVVTLFETREGLVGNAADLLVDEAGFGVVDAAAIGVNGGEYENAERLVATAAVEARSRGAGEVRDPSMTRQFFAGAKFDVGEWLAVGRRRKANCCWWAAGAARRRWCC